MFQVDKVFALFARIENFIFKKDCPVATFGRHDWQKTHHLNSHFYHHGALDRSGKVCLRCLEIQFDETDEEFYNKLPEWLKNDPELGIPKRLRRKLEARKQRAKGHHLTKIFV